MFAGMRYREFLMDYLCDRAADGGSPSVPIAT
jgi:hypothetical protein